eukprot:scaffold130938_cov57-Phaeocystis_antarctica.AAC.1
MSPVPDVPPTTASGVSGRRAHPGAAPHGSAHRSLRRRRGALQRLAAVRPAPRRLPAELRAARGQGRAPRAE